MAEQELPKHESSSQYLDQEEYTLRKRLPRKFPKRKTDVYVNRKTDFKAQIARCMKLLESGNNEIYIHGLGAAVNRAINLALQIKKTGLGTIDLAANTSTVELTDDFEPEKDDLEPETRSRNNSAIHIRVFRKNPAELTSEGTTKPMTSS
jgi:ribonuclease P/MRP protein subunit RPP20